MKFPRPEPPTESEWALQDVTVIKQLGDPSLGDPSRIGLRKKVTKDGVSYEQAVWLTVGQLREVAIEMTF